jgi:hypothetical protein
MAVRSEAESDIVAMPGGARRQLLVQSALVVGLAYVGFLDPHRQNVLMPRCPTKLVTGLDCPACGGLRMVHDLLHGRLRAALRDNPFLLLMIPIVAVYLLVRGGPSSAKRDEVPPRVAAGVIGVAVVWMVVRNLPSWPWKPGRDERVPPLRSRA